MAKLIKRTDAGGPDAEAGDVASPKSAIIGRDTVEARTEGQGIRERAVQQAEDTVAQAHVQAEELLKQAHAEANALREQAKDEGYQEGRVAGAAEFTEAVTRTALRMQEIEGQLVPQLTDLAIGIARKILGKELEFHPEAVVQLVKQALGEKARQRREVALRVHPDDLQMLRDSKPDLLEMLNRTKELSIREDPNVERHGVIIETDAGIIDAQLETQLAVFERVLSEIR